jgi:gamma-glutamyltranspeptidase / glutathione hydrolase
MKTSSNCRVSDGVSRRQSRQMGVRPRRRIGAVLAVAAAGAALMLTACTGISPTGLASGSAASVGFRYVAPEQPPPPEAASGWIDKPGWSARRHMVAAAHPLATDAGLQVLRAGGSAVDAAIAVQMVLTLVEPQSSGIGGGLFMMLVDGGRVRALDGRETAPAAAGGDLFLKDGQPIPFAQAMVGGRSVGTPGVLRALAMAHREHGRLPWAALFQPAITLAEQGFVIGPRLASLLREPTAQTLRRDAAAAALYFEPDGRPKAVGTRLRNPELAATLRLVADRGSDAFYRGPVAADIVRAVRGHPTQPGLLGEADLAGYAPRWRDPLCFDYRQWRLCGMPPPSSGPLALAQMLGILEQQGQREGRPLQGLRPVPAPFGLEPDPEAVHRIAEAGRLAFADRARYVADPDFVALPGGSERALLHPRYLAERAALIGERSLGVARAGQPMPEIMSWADDRQPGGGGTSQISVVDSRGQAVSMTSTIEAAFGAQIVVRGFLLNNQLTDFSFVPQEQGRPVANRVEPLKRPRSSMAPMLVFERAPQGAASPLGPLVMTLGSPGGSAIIPYVAKVLIGTLDWGLDAQQAISLPNFGSRNGPTELEQGRSTPALADALRARGHEVRVMPQTSGLQAIERRAVAGAPGWFGGADPRREGVAAGD